MNSVFSVSVKYLKLVEGGEGYKKMNEVFLVNAVFGLNSATRMNAAPYRMYFRNL